MSRSDMLSEIKRGNYYIDRAFMVDYSRYFGDMDDDSRLKLLGADNCAKIGEAFKRERDVAYSLIEQGKLNVEWPGGWVIKRHPPGKLRQKYNALIKDGEHRSTYIKMIRDLLGYDNPITKHIQEDDIPF